MRSRPTPEHALLRLALVLKPTQRQREVAARLVAQISDPTLLLETATVHGLALALRDLLMDAGTTPELQRALQHHARGLAVRAIVAEVQVGQLLGVLRSAGVQPLVLKGPALAKGYYEPAGRIYEDIDILVRESALDAAQRALQASGYAAPDTVPAPMEGEFRRRYGERVFRGPGLLDVDLHWRLSQHLWPLAWAPEEVFARHRLLHLGDADVPVPCPEDLLLYLASHAAKDGYRRWLWIVDFARVVDRERGIDFEALGLHAKRLGILRSLACALALAIPLLPTPLGSYATRLAEWGPADSLARRILATPPRSAVPHLPPWKTWGMAGRLRDGPRYRLTRPLWDVLLPTPNEWNLLAGVPFSNWLAPSLRLCRIAYRTLGSVLRVR